MKFAKSIFSLYISLALSLSLSPLPFSVFISLPASISVCLSLNLFLFYFSDSFSSSCLELGLLELFASNGRYTEDDILRYIPRWPFMSAHALY